MLEMIWGLPCEVSVPVVPKEWWLSVCDHYLMGEKGARRGRDGGGDYGGAR